MAVTIDGPGHGRRFGDGPVENAQPSALSSVPNGKRFARFCSRPARSARQALRRSRTFVRGSDSAETALRLLRRRCLGSGRTSGVRVSAPVFRAHGRAEAEICHAAIKVAGEPRLRRVDSVRRKLFAVRAQVRGRKSQLRPRFSPAFTVPRMVYSRPSICVAFAKFPSSTACRIAVLLTTSPFTVTGLNADDVEIVSRAELFQQSEIARAIFAEGPFVADANFAQRLRIGTSCRDEFLRRGRGELAIEMRTRAGARRRDRESARSCAGSRSADAAHRSAATLSSDADRT